jgi:integrase/recombinase XerD
MGAVTAVKIDGHGQAAVLSEEEISLLFSSGFQSDRDRALFGVCLFAATRINEACSLYKEDCFDRLGRVRPALIVRKSHSKGQLATRTIPVHPELRLLLLAYQPQLDEKNPYLFPGRHPNHHWKHLHSQSAHKILQEACRRVGIEGASTHSFRRTALTKMSDQGIPLRVIQQISGHRSLAVLQRYLEVSDAQVRGAIASLSAFSCVNTSKRGYPRLEPEAFDSRLEMDSSAGSEPPY